VSAADRLKVLKFIADHTDLADPSVVVDELVDAIEGGAFEPDPPIDTTNDFLLGQRGSRELAFGLAPTVIGRDQAIRLAAWLLVLADPLEETFPKVLEAVKNT
jgi:hypothetical protein